MGFAAFRCMLGVKEQTSRITPWKGLDHHYVPFKRHTYKYSAPIPPDQTAPRPVEVGLDRCVDSDTCTTMPVQHLRPPPLRTSAQDMPGMVDGETLRERRRMSPSSAVLSQSASCTVMLLTLPFVFIVWLGTRQILLGALNRAGRRGRAAPPTYHPVPAPGITCRPRG
jgi:hypothetical protein